MKYAQYFQNAASPQCSQRLLSPSAFVAALFMCVTLDQGKIAFNVPRRFTISNITGNWYERCIYLNKYMVFIKFYYFILYVGWIVFIYAVVMTLIAEFVCENQIFRIIH